MFLLLKAGVSLPGDLKKSLATVKKYILKHNFSFLKTVSGLFFKPGRTEDLKNNLKLNVNLGFYSAHLSSHGLGLTYPGIIIRALLSLLLSDLEQVVISLSLNFPIFF